MDFSELAFVSCEFVNQCVTDPVTSLSCGGAQPDEQVHVAGTGVTEQIQRPALLGL
jgi:hypothetical protein